MNRVSAMVALALTSACMHSGKPSGPSAQQPTVERPTPATAAGIQGLEAFSARLKEYSALHDRLEKTLPPLPKETNPQILDKHERALAALLGEHRKTAKRSDLFTADGERAIRAELAKVFSGPDGAALRSSIMDENPVTVKLAVNGRYPDEVPLSTMPPQVLAALPKLPPELEYRFSGPRLVLLDVHAHTIADYIENVLPQ